jgi:hypothetical protein
MTSDHLASTRAVDGSVALAPIVVFAYARIDHLRRAVESLLANREAAASDVVFFCDAAARPAHQVGVEAVRAYVENVEGFRSVRRVYRERNLGLARSVIDGVGQMLAEYGRAIVVEDDLLLSPHFLRFMNDALVRYEPDVRVASIHGYCYPIDEALPQTFFLEGADCWGWATWARAWAHFEPDGSKLLAQLRARDLTRAFDLDGQQPCTRMLQDQVHGRNSSWAIRWHAACFLKGLLTLYPGRSLVENIGNDASGTHGANTDMLSRAPASSPIAVGPIAVEPSKAGRDAFVRFLRSRTPPLVRARRWLSALKQGAAP